MIRKHKRSEVSINSSSMADIAFLLLIFFLVTTTIINDKGLDLVLPPYSEVPPAVPRHERNIYTILINSKDEVLCEGERLPTGAVTEGIITFIKNPERLVTLSENPQKAIVSIKANRGCSHQQFIEVLDRVKAAYYTLYAIPLAMSNESIRQIDQSSPQYPSYTQLREQYPMNISIAQ